MSLDALTEQAIAALTDPHQPANVRLETLRALLHQIDRLYGEDALPSNHASKTIDPIVQALHSVGTNVDTRLATLSAIMQTLDTRRAYAGLARPATLNHNGAF